MSSKNQDIRSISCDICDDAVTMVSKRKKLWVCTSCDEKYPIYKND